MPLLHSQTKTLYRILEGTECHISARDSGSLAPLMDSCAKTEFNKNTIVQVDTSLEKQNNLLPVVTTVKDIKRLIGEPSTQTIVWVGEEDLTKF